MEGASAFLALVLLLERREEWRKQASSRMSKTAPITRAVSQERAKLMTSKVNTTAEDFSTDPIQTYNSYIKSKKKVLKPLEGQTERGGRKRREERGEKGS